MSWPVAYRGQASGRSQQVATVAAATLGWGIQTSALALAGQKIVAGYFAIARANPGAVAAAGRLGPAVRYVLPRLGLAGLAAFGAVELWRWWQGGLALYSDSEQGAGWAVSGQICDSPTVQVGTCCFLNCGWNAFMDSTFEDYQANPYYRHTVAGVDGWGTTYMGRERPFFPGFREFYTGAHYFKPDAVAGIADEEPTVPPLIDTPPIWLAVPINAAGSEAEPYKPATTPRPQVAGDASYGGQPTWAEPQARPWNPTITLAPGQTIVGARPDIRAVADAGTMEQKLKASRGVITMIQLFNASTEYCDMISAMFKAIPPSARNMAGGGKANCLEQQAAVFANIERLNWNTAIVELLWQEFTDGIWAKLGIDTKTAGLAYGTNAPVNTALGKVSGDQLAKALKEWRKAFDAGLGEFALQLPKITARPGRWEANA